MKKKRFFMLFFLLFVMLSFVGCLGSSRVYAYYARGTTLTTDDVKAIMNKIGMPVPSNTRVNNYRDTINGLINSLYSSYSDFTLENMVFYYYNNSLYVVLQNGSVGNSFDFLCIHYYNGNSTIGRYISSGYSGDQIVWFTMDQLQTFYKITETGYSTDSNSYPSFSYTTVPFESGDNTINISQVTPLWNYDSCASFIGVGGTGIPNDSCAWRVLGNAVQLSGWVAPTATPTPTPTPTSTPAGGGGTDLTLTNSYIAEVKDEVHNARVDSNERLDEIISKIPTSGDIAQGTVSGNEEYWGTDVDSGEVQDTFSGDLVGIIDSMSGDLNSNKAVTAFQDFEENFLALLSSSNPLDLDFIIDYPNINTLTFSNNGNVDGEKLLISGDSINLSQMCRDNATLGNIQDTVRMLFNFGFGVSLIIYVYNLIISTLGIDNPFLYDDPETMHTSIMDDVNDNGTVTTYITRTKSNRLKHISKSTRGRIHYD